MVNCKYLPDQPHCHPSDTVHLIDVIAICWVFTLVVAAALVVLFWLDRRKKEK